MNKENLMYIPGEDNRAKLPEQKSFNWKELLIRLGIAYTVVTSCDDRSQMSASPEDWVRYDTQATKTAVANSIKQGEELRENGWCPGETEDNRCPTSWKPQIEK